MGLETPTNNSVVVESRPSAAAGVYEQILSRLEANGFGQDDVFAVHLALEEAFHNAIKHGNKMDRTRKVTIEYSISPDRAEISLIDQGQGFDPDGVPDPRCGVNLYKPEGRGLLLMCSYMDEVRFNERGNRVYMVRYKERPYLAKTETKKQPTARP